MSISRYIDSIPFIESMKGYRLGFFKKDLIAGLTIGLIAVPLSMALAINSGVAPQYGLYTAIVAGFFIAICGGSRFNISGPTAAFVIILQPITNQYGLVGLLTASFLAGIILLIMGLLRLGRMIFFVPQSVVTGFSMGIAVVIALTQLPDFFGAIPTVSGTDFVSRLQGIAQVVAQASWADVFLGCTTLAGMLIFPKIFKGFPPHLFVLLLAVALGALLSYFGFEFRTIYSVFSYTLDGKEYAGIPPILPAFSLPWTDTAGSSFLSLKMIQDLLPLSFTIALLGAIESLLCAVVADGMTDTHHRPNAELVGQGIGNIIAPFFGGFAATGALARTATSIRAGAKTPLAAIIHSLFVLMVLLLFTPFLNRLPMASLAALLLVVAWGMADFRYFKGIFSMMPRQDKLVLFTCFSLTIIFDMVVAVMIGMLLACALFMRRVAKLTTIDLLSDEETVGRQRINIDKSFALEYRITGPFFFGVARKAIDSMARLSTIGGSTKVIIIYLQSVPFIDLSGLIAFKLMIEHIQSKDMVVILSGLNNDVKKTLGKAGLSPKKNTGIYWANTTEEAAERAMECYVKFTMMK